MKKAAVFLLLFLYLAAMTGCAPEPQPTETTVPVVTTSVPVTETTVPPTTVTEPPQPVYTFTEEEQQMLLKIGMAERGETGCTECIALVMRTILNRVESGRFGSTIQGVLFAQDQFTPVSDGSYYRAEPNDACREALELITYGWDESQGALYYEWCEGESWHSQNLHLLFQHCDVRFYD